MNAPSNPTFEPDEKIAKMAVLYALDAIDLAKNNFGLVLDGSEESVAAVESILEKLHSSLSSQKPPEPVLWNFAKAFGSYVGEVFRKHHGGEWGMISHGNRRFPGMRSKPEVLFWPWERMRNRIVNGAEDNVVHYYKWLASK